MLTPKYKVIGLTGGIGVGKTFVSKVFIKLGVPVFNADQEAKKIMYQSLDLRKKIKQEFGNEVFQNDQLQKKILSKLIFNNKNKLNLLNSLVHPYVLDRFNEWCLNNKSSIVLKESAILFESNTHTGCDKIICVTASESIRIARVIQRDNTDIDHVKSIISSQMNQDKKIKNSDFIIKNNDSDLILPQVISIINSIKSMIS